MYHLQRKNQLCFAVAVRSKRRKVEDMNQRVVYSDADPGIGITDYVNEFNNFGDLEVPDLSFTPYTAPDKEFLASQNSLYQARSEDITLCEESFSCQYHSSQLAFGEELLQPFNEDVFQIGPSEQSDTANLMVLSRRSAKRCFSEPSVNPILEHASDFTLALVKNVQFSGVSCDETTEISKLDVEQIASSIDLHYHTPIRESQPHRKRSFTGPPEKETADISPATKQSKRASATGCFITLVTDRIVRLPTDQLRYNMNHSEETCFSPNYRLAQPCGWKSSRGVLTRSLSHTFALPANLDNVFSTVLYGLWCRHQGWCEQTRCLPDLKDTTSLDNAPCPTRIVLDVSREDPRAGHTIASLQPPTDSLLSSSLLTEQHGTFKSSLVLSEDKFQLANDCLESTSISKDPIAEQGTSCPVISATLLGTLPEENLGQQRPSHETDHIDLSVKGCSWDHVQRHLHEYIIRYKTDGFTITQICPTGSTKRNAALLFYTLLDLAKHGKIILYQDHPFSPIKIVAA